MTAFLDSHAHLADPAFDADRESVIENARAAGAVGVVCIGAVIQQDLDDFVAVRTHGFDQGAFAQRAALVDVGFLFQQVAHDRRIAVRGSEG